MSQSYPVLRSDFQPLLIEPESGPHLQYRCSLHLYRVDSPDHLMSAQYLLINLLLLFVLHRLARLHIILQNHLEDLTLINVFCDPCSCESDRYKKCDNNRKKGNDSASLFHVHVPPFNGFKLIMSAYSLSFARAAIEASRSSS